MGQYYRAFDLSSGEVLNEEDMGDSPKLNSMAFAPMGGVASALVLLMAHGEGLSCEEVRLLGGVVGRWAGEEIVLLGDEVISPQMQARIDACIQRQPGEELEDITGLVIEEIQRRAPYISYSTAVHGDECYGTWEEVERRVLK